MTEEAKDVLPLEIPKLEVREVDIDSLREHPQNYRSHPDDQLEHICQSVRERGIYRNIVVANDSTILAGHGVVKACRKLGLKTVPVHVINLPHDDVRAIKLLTADNEVSHLGIVDDRLLSELLKMVKDHDSLLGTGYDEKMLANLVFVTRPASEIRDINEASEYIGMPDFELSPSPIKTVISFENDEDKRRFYELVGLKMNDKHTDSIWWPEKERMDLISVKVEATEEEHVEEPAK